MAPTPEETAAQAGTRSAQAALRKRGAKGATVEVARKPDGLWPTPSGGAPRTVPIPAPLHAHPF